MSLISEIKILKHLLNSLSIRLSRPDQALAKQFVRWDHSMISSLRLIIVEWVRSKLVASILNYFDIMWYILNNIYTQMKYCFTIHYILGHGIYIWYIYILIYIVDISISSEYRATSWYRSIIKGWCEITKNHDCKASEYCNR